MILPYLLLLSLPFVRGIPRVDLVLSHFNEPIAEVVAMVNKSKGLMKNADIARVFLYTHSSTPLQDVPAGWIVKESGSNKGRESENYLSFLVDHMHEVNDIVWFSQSRPDGYMQDKLWQRLPLITQRTGMIGLSIWEQVSCDAGIYPGLGKLIEQIYAMVYQDFCHGTWTAFFNGEFAVSRKRIQRHTVRLYKHLRDDLDAPVSDTWIHVDQLPGGNSHRESTLVDPALGYAMERTWNLVFGCTDAPGPCCVGNEACPVDSCQCLD